jgi:hypothetical protein
MRVNHPLWNARDIFFFWIEHAFHVLLAMRLLIQPHMQLFSPRWVPYWIITLEFYALSIKRHSKDGRLLRGVWNSTSWRGGKIDLIIQKKRGEEHYFVLCVLRKAKNCVCWSNWFRAAAESRFGNFLVITSGSICADQRIIFGRLWSFPLSRRVAAHNIYTHTRALSAASQKYKTANFFPSFVSGRRTIWLLRSTLFMWFIHGSLLNHFC